MNLLDIISKPVSELTDEELMDRLHMLKRLRLVDGKPSIRKPNEDRRLEDALSSLSEEELAELANKLEGLE